MNRLNGTVWGERDELQIPWCVTPEWREVERRAYLIEKSNEARARTLARRRNLERQRRRQSLIALSVIAAIAAVIIGSIL